MRKRVGAAVIAVLSVGGLLLGTGSAQAAGKDIPTTWVIGPYGYEGHAYFNTVGDDLWVCDDYDGDSYGVSAYLYDDTTGTRLESVYDGVPETQCVSSNKNLDEGIRVYIRVCLQREKVDEVCADSTLGTT
ncbi:hypothetical protein SAMN05216223_12256 [Actinacidiphila yanglinensis]|uniref:Secreted protein n=1 Tax=Actinacidiphila yanglinensis TaxID=310779 RepID=A0A1H6E183_9ACTN|nr:hypothetical protein [Actinacidiphila yanglinensis]SEG90685.1 hypothetical protein SAMN05216223_12256 [Actinacidiphila yanglinensis]